MRYFITFSYDGSKYNGYQKQPRVKTIQGELEKALKQINAGRNVSVSASGRTDAGVHAYNQSAHFDLETEIACAKFDDTIVEINAPFFGINFLAFFWSKIYSAINNPDIFPVNDIYSPDFESLAKTPSLSASGSVAKTKSASCFLANFNSNFEVN